MLLSNSAFNNIRAPHWVDNRPWESDKHLICTHCLGRHSEHCNPLANTGYSQRNEYNHNHSTHYKIPGEFNKSDVTEIILRDENLLFVSQQSKMAVSFSRTIGCVIQSGFKNIRP